MDKGISNCEISIINRCLKNIVIIIELFNISLCSILNKHGIIYIGEWSTPGAKVGYPNLKVGQHGFISRNCSFTNCFYTTDHYYFNDLRNYDVLLINAKHFCNNAFDSLPDRIESQQFIFIGFEPSVHCSIIQSKIQPDLTWTYKLTSDIVRPFFIVKNRYNQVIGPRKYMHWDTRLEDIPDVEKYVSRKLSEKNTAAFYMRTNCDNKTEQHQFVQKLEEELARYGQEMHTYGICGNNQCTMKYQIDRISEYKCSELIQKNYYFYLAIEETLGEDVVTDNLLYALDNFAIPIVYGGANYTRFVLDLDF